MRHPVHALLRGAPSPEGWEALPGHKQSSPGDETESESPGFVNDRVSSTVLRGPRTLTLAIPLTHEHGW